jgi:hypothetical protein
MRIRVFIVCAAAAGVLLSCGGGKTDRLTRGDRRLARVVAELTLLRERAASDSAYADSSLALLRRRRITPAAFSRRVARMNDKPERWAAFYAEVRSALDTSRSSAAAPR